MVPYHNRRFRSILCSFIRSRQSRFSTAFRLTPTLVLQGSRAVVTRSAHFPRGGHLWTMDDVILVRCGRDVQLKSFISLVEEDGGTFSEGRCELKGESNSKSELNNSSIGSSQRSRCPKPTLARWYRRPLLLRRSSAAQFWGFLRVSLLAKLRPVAVSERIRFDFLSSRAKAR